MRQGHDVEHGLKREELVSAIIVDIEEARCDLAAIFRLVGA